MRGVPHATSGLEVRVHAAQEADAHEQLPQLLRAFGFRFAVPPGFYSTLEFQGPHELVNLSTQGLRFVHGDEFTEWVGLDGSTIPLYLPQAGPFSPEREARAGLLHVPGLPRLLPRHGRDRRPVDRRAPGRIGFVVLDEALEERYAAAPPRSRARLWSDWSYAEGIRAEELGRAGRRAETAVLAAESLGALARLLVGRRPDRLDAIWKTILTAQHHDAWCFSAPLVEGEGDRLAGGGDPGGARGRRLGGPLRSRTPSGPPDLPDGSPWSSSTRARPRPRRWSRSSCPGPDGPRGSRCTTPPGTG